MVRGDYLLLKLSNWETNHQFFWLLFSSVYDKYCAHFLSREKNNFNPIKALVFGNHMVTVFELFYSKNWSPSIHEKSKWVFCVFIEKTYKALIPKL